MAPVRLVRIAAALAGIGLGLAAVPAVGQNAAGLATALKQRLDLFALGAHNRASAVEPRLAPDEIAALRNLGAAYAGNGDLAALVAGWELYVAASRPAAADIDALVSLVLRECYRAASDELKDYVRKLQEAERDAGEGAPPAPRTVVIVLAPMTILRLPLPAGDAPVSLDLENTLGKQQHTIDMSAVVAETLRDTALAVLGSG